MPSTYTPLATQSISSPTASVTFSSIPATYTDLILITKVIRSTSSIMIVRFNGDSGTNYSELRLEANGTTIASATNINVGYGVIDFANNNTTPNAVATHFQNYSSTTVNKSFISRSNQGDAVTFIYAGLWRSNSAINSIVVSHFNNHNFTAGSILTLYGIKAA